MKYNKKFDFVIEKLSNIDNEDCLNILEEVKKLSEIYQKKDDRLNRIIKVSDKQQMAILNLNEELDIYKNHLEDKVEEEISKREKQEKILFEQSRLASIAEMIDAVAHQWIQPLNIISIQMSLMQLETHKNNGISPKVVDMYRDKVSMQITHLTETLNNFRDFFRPIDTNKLFSVKKEVNSVLKLISDDMVMHNINTVMHCDGDFTISGNKNEFKHILLNFISNAKYEFLQNNIKNRMIHINISRDKKSVDVIDNAGGIDKSIIDNIFNMHITTKEGNGTGIGLYMSQKIAYKHNAELFASNIDDGAKFTFKLKDTE
jgi:signal transduction histidine kinase